MKSRALKSRATWFVPGRLEIFGKHTDYAGGRSLVAAVPRGFTVSAERAGDGLVIVTDASSGETAEFPASGADGRIHIEGWRRYPATVIHRLAANFPGADLSSRITFSSDLPQDAGISSSSALVIAVAEALIACAGIDETDQWRATIATPEDRAAYFGCIENGSRFGPLAGAEGVGTHGGSEDHAAIVLSRAGYLLQVSFSPAGTPAPRLAGLPAFASLRRARGAPSPRSAPRLLHVERALKMPAGWTFVVAWSGVRAAKTGAAMEAYNRLADPRAMTGDRLAHFTAENARVAEAADAFARADIARIGKLAAASQRDADRLLGNQVQETRDLVTLALDHGAAAASAFGAGWGGSVWALVEESAAAVFLGAWLGAYCLRHPDLDSNGFIAPPAAGARITAQTD